MLTDTKTTGPTNFNLFIFSQVLRKIQFIHVIFNLLFSHFLRLIMTLLLSTVMFCMSTVFLRTCQNHLYLLLRISAEWVKPVVFLSKHDSQSYLCWFVTTSNLTFTSLLLSSYALQVIFFAGHLEKSF